MTVSKALDQGSQVPDLAQNGQFGVRHGRPSMTGMAWRTAVTRAGCLDKPTARAARQRWRKYAVASAPRRPATPSLDSSRGRSRFRGGRMPRLAASGPGLTRGSVYSASPARMGESGIRLRDLWASHPAIAGGNVHPVQAVSSCAAPSHPSRCQAAWSPVPTTPLTTAPGTQKALSRQERALTCGN
jgi:hypothetical protein